MGRLYRFIDSTLDTDISPLAYLYVVHALVWGVAYSFLDGLSSGVQNTVLFKAGVLFGHNFWGLMLLLGGAVLLYGMLRKHCRATQVGSGVLFMAWTFAAITYATNGYWHFLFPLAVVEILSWGYYYLAVSMGRLWNYTPKE